MADLYIQKTMTDIGEIPAGPTYITYQTFEGAGYDDPMSTGEEWAPSGTVDPDFLTDGDDPDLGAIAPANWEDQCLQVVAPAGSTPNTHTDMVGGAKAPIYLRVDIILGVLGTAAASWLRSLATMYHSTSPPTHDTEPFKLSLQRAVGGYYLYLNVRSGGSDSGIGVPSLSTIAINTLYVVQIKWDPTAGLYSWYIGDTEQSSGAIADAHPDDAY